MPVIKSVYVRVVRRRRERFSVLVIIVARAAQGRKEWGKYFLLPRFEFYSRLREGERESWKGVTNRMSYRSVLFQRSTEFPAFWVENILKRIEWFEHTEVLRIPPCAFTWCAAEITLLKYLHTRLSQVVLSFVPLYVQLMQYIIVCGLTTLTSVHVCT